MIDNLHAARGALFDDLFSRAWSLLDEAARRVLLALTLFPASASHAALGITASIGALAFDRAVDMLADLSLFDVQPCNVRSHPRYALHPLVRAFAREKLAEQPGFEADARERWVEWYCQLAAQVGFCWK